MGTVRYAVRRLFATREDIVEVLSGPAVVATFATREEAEADRAARLSELRGLSSPFDFCQGCLSALTSLEPGILCDWLLDAGIDPPAADADGNRDWDGWWDRSEADWSPLQRERAWQAFDRVPLFDIIEQKPPRKLYVVMEVGWYWFDEPPFHSGPETQRPVEAFTSREKAEQRRAELEAARRAGYRWDDEFQWVGAGGEDQYGETEYAPFYQVVEIDGEV
jgi:hypothetical protein